MSWRDRGPAVRATVQLVQFIAMINSGVVIAYLLMLLLSWGYNKHPHALGWFFFIVPVTCLLFAFWYLSYKEEVSKDQWEKRP